jgi:hypothetical protein
MFSVCHPMADYYSIITKAVSALDKNTESARRKLYERARAALITGMRRAVPALNQSDILVARISLEEAIGKVEAEARRGHLAHRPIATPSTSLPHAGVVAASSRPAMKNGEYGSGQLMRFWTRVLRRDGDGAPANERGPRGALGEPLSGYSSGETDSGHGRDNWLSEVLARASRDGRGDDDQDFAPPRELQRNR